MRIFVTGGAGFIGSHLVDRLVADGHLVTVYDNLTSGKREFIAHHLNQPNPKVRLVQADCLDFTELSKAITDHNTVFHLAANPDARRGNTETDLDLKLETIATYNVLEAMRRNKIKNIVFSSSGTIYGEVPVKPIPEDFGPSLPISLYGAGKVASEALCSAFAGTFDFQVHIFRFVNIIGGRATHGVIFDFVKKLEGNPAELEILGDGRQEKPYLLVDECVDGIVFGWEHSREQLNVFNLGHPSSTTVTRIAEIVREEMRLPQAKFKYTGGDRGWRGDVPQYRADVSKINRLGWQTKTNSNEAVRETVRRILKERQLVTAPPQSAVSQPIPPDVSRPSMAVLFNNYHSPKIKQIVVIAGGLATRLYPLTLNMPKSMVSILGRPFIDYQLALFQANGIEEVVLCVGNLAEQIEEHLGDGSRFDLKISYSRENQPLDTGGAVHNALPYLDKVFFVIYGDSFLIGDYQQFATAFLRNNTDGAISVWQNNNQVEPSRILVDGELIKQYRKDPPPLNAQHAEWGLNIFKKSVIEQSDSGSFPISNYFDRLAPQKKLLAWPTKQRFYEIGSHDGLLDTTRLITIYGMEKILAYLNSPETLELPKIGKTGQEQVTKEPVSTIKEEART